MKNGEPVDGDFARYVEQLTTAGGGEPGRVYRRPRAARIAIRSPATPPGHLPAASPATPATKSGRDVATFSPGPTPLAPVTLTRSKPSTRVAMNQARVLSVLALVACLSGIQSLVQAADVTNGTAERFVPGIIEIASATWLYWLAGRARGARPITTPAPSPISQPVPQAPSRPTGSSLPTDP